MITSFVSFSRSSHLFLAGIVASEGLSYAASAAGWFTGAFQFAFPLCSSVMAPDCSRRDVLTALVASSVCFGVLISIRGCSIHEYVWLRERKARGIREHRL